jgi:PAS domain-containing protein
MPTSPPAADFSSTEDRKRFQDEGAPTRPLLALDREGTIQSLTPAARSVLEYTSDAHVDACFFSHVHARNMRRVMHDLADMVCRGKQRVQWLLRLRTGNKRWRWYRAFVQNCLGQREDAILVRLRPL